MASGSDAGHGLVGIAKVLGWMMANISGFMEITMRPVKPSPRFELIEARFPLCSLCWSVILARLGSPTILVRMGCRKNAKSWSALSGICQSRAIGLYRVGAACSWRDFLREKNRAGSAGRTVREERVGVAGNGVSSGTGRSGERSWVGGMFHND